jgi:hypothetical protein
MGLFELLDYACAALTEAGYADVWAWTPRKIFHRLDVHNRLAANRRLVDFETGLLAARGDEKQVRNLVQRTERLASPRTAATGEDSGERRAAPKEHAAAMDEELRKAGWA